ncbi:hypothetical protein EMCG_00898 [[Emmonsia] crescens]|uniref:Uncharacterized protein n=1 Tax=[Emmonsia] crescens TaxID=73230 RepID=A0A0G2J636_9EURO|nr:hypothetical protein EMCG_00898 [Emmonsia crescens UAMH 3008]
MFSKNLVAAIMVSVAQNVFTNQLEKNLSTYVPNFDGQGILDIGATQIRSKVPQSFTIRCSFHIISR